MKHALVIALLMATGCEEQTKCNQYDEICRASVAPKKEYILPSGTSVTCETHDAYNSLIVLRGCTSASRSSPTEVRCSHGVCWEGK
jgi:hypothetical protein